MQCKNFSQNLSWFSLFEPISKKERERVLFCFRLLSHSLKSESFKNQILGDVYLSLNELGLAMAAYHESFMISLQEKDVYGLLVVMHKIITLGQSNKSYIASISVLIDKKNPSYIQFFSEIMSN